MSDRDTYKPKHPTPVGAATLKAPQRRDPFAGTPTVDATAAAHELARRERENFETHTPIGDADPAAILAFRTYDRANRASVSADGIRLEMAVLKTDNADLKALVLSLSRDVATLNGSVQTLAQETQAQRSERVERDRRAETRAEEADKREAERELRELEDRRAKRRQVLGIWIPTLTALGALVATIITAMRDPNVKYVPMVPNTPTIGSAGSP